jgi:hypothetical protein
VLTELTGTDIALVAGGVIQRPLPPGGALINDLKSVASDIVNGRRAVAQT